jgi:hypothetical protein
MDRPSLGFTVCAPIMHLTSLTCRTAARPTLPCQFPGLSGDLWPPNRPCTRVDEPGGPRPAEQDWLVSPKVRPPLVKPTLGISIFGKPCGSWSWIAPSTVESGWRSLRTAGPYRKLRACFLPGVPPGRHYSGHSVEHSSDGF